jgi:hypothetical protein
VTSIPALPRGYKSASRGRQCGAFSFGSLWNEKKSGAPPQCFIGELLNSQNKHAQLAMPIDWRDPCIQEDTVHTPFTSLFRFIVTGVVICSSFRAVGQLNCPEIREGLREETRADGSGASDVLAPLRFENSFPVLSERQTAAKNAVHGDLLTTVMAEFVPGQSAILAPTRKTVAAHASVFPLISGSDVRASSAIGGVFSWPLQEFRSDLSARTISSAVVSSRLVRLSALRDKAPRPPALSDDMAGAFPLTLDLLAAGITDRAETFSAGAKNAGW